MLVCAPLCAQGNNAAADSGGNFYPVTARFDGRRDYIHISKLDVGGYLIWDADYATNFSQKPVAAAAGPDNLIILSARQMQNYKTLALAAYSYQNYLVWETAFDDGAQIVPVAVVVDSAGNIYACGQTRSSTGQYRAKLWKYDRNGGYLWAVEYGNSGNSYAQQVQLLYNGSIELGVKAVTGGAEYGQYRRMSLIYSPDGQLLN